MQCAMTIDWCCNDVKTRYLWLSFYAVPRSSSVPGARRIGIQHDGDISNANDFHFYNGRKIFFVNSEPTTLHAPQSDGRISTCERERYIQPDMHDVHRASTFHLSHKSNSTPGRIYRNNRIQNGDYFFYTESDII